MSKPSLLAWEQGVDNRLNTSVDQSFEDLVGGHRARRWDDSSLGPLQVLFGFGIATTSALLQTLGILSWRKQEERKPRNQDFKAIPAWIISSGQIESGPGSFPGLTCWRAAANSLDEKSTERFTGDGMKVIAESSMVIAEKSALPCCRTCH